MKRDCLGESFGTLATEIKPNFTHRASHVRIYLGGFESALNTSNRSPAYSRRKASAIWLRAEFPVHRKSTFALLSMFPPMVAAEHRGEPLMGDNSSALHDAQGFTRHQAWSTGGGPLLDPRRIEKCP